MDNLPNTEPAIMNRKTFLHSSAVLVAAPLVAPFQILAQQPPLKNWAGNFTFSTSNIEYPATAGEVKQLLSSSAHYRILGTRHCFNRIADSTHLLISSSKMNRVVALDAQAQTVTVEGGIKYGELAPYLHEKGYALHNLASLPHISVAGSITTATHGSGMRHGNLATAVRALEIVTPDGSTRTLAREKDGEWFDAAVVGLGALGMITRVTLALQPTFSMRQHVFLQLPMEQLKSHFDAIMGAGYSVSLFTDWQSDSINEVWIKSRVGEGTDYSGANDFFGARAATKDMHPIAELSAENCTPQLGVVGPWYERLPHFKMGFTPSSGKELQAEYFVPHEKAVEALQAVQQLGKTVGPHLFISEIRTIAADELWLSPCYGRNSVAIHFTLRQEIPEVQKLLPQIEKALEPYSPRPHWGKLFTMPAHTLAKQYDKWTAFKKMVKEFDPNGKLRNDFLKKTIYA